MKPARPPGHLRSGPTRALPVRSRPVQRAAFSVHARCMSKLVYRPDSIVTSSADPAALKELAPCSMLQQPTSASSIAELPQLWRELVQRVHGGMTSCQRAHRELNGTFHSSFATRPIASASRKHRSASLHSPGQHPGDTPTPTIARVRSGLQCTSRPAGPPGSSTALSTQTSGAHHIQCTATTFRTEAARSWRPVAETT